MDYMNQLLDGKHLDGRASDLDREKILQMSVLTFMPDGNPGGRAHDPNSPGGRSEKLDENTYVDVNADRRSTFVRLVRQMHEKYDYNQFLDLHQAGDAPSFLFLPAVFRLLSEKQQEYITGWAEAVLQSWQEAGFEPDTRLRVAYEGGERQKNFIHCYEELENRAATLTLEVQRSNPAIPPDKQLLLEEIGIRTSVNWMLQRGHEWR